MPEPGSYGHEAAPRPGTFYSLRLGREVPDLSHSGYYPVEAFCLWCGEMIRLEHFIAIGEGGEWQHTGRKPGESLR